MTKDQAALIASERQRLERLMKTGQKWTRALRELQRRCDHKRPDGIAAIIRIDNELACEYCGRKL